MGYAREPGRWFSRRAGFTSTAGPARSMTATVMTKTVRRGRGRPRKSEDPKHGEILRAALRAFAQGGYEGTNLRRIAADAGVDVALIAHHFGSKLALWKAAVDGLAVRRLTVTEEAPVSSGKVHIADRVRLALRRYIDINSDVPELGMFVTQEMQGSSERRDYVYEHLIKPHHDLLVPLIREAIAAGAIRPQDPDMLFFLLVTSISTSMAIRPLIARFSEAAGSMDHFRDALEQSVMANVLAV
jgi:TetR/AcrR family transcriptional regulator